MTPPPRIGEDGPLAQLAARMTVAIGRSELGGELQAKTLLCLVDFIGCALDASRTETGQRIADFARGRGKGAREASGFGLPDPLDAETAALLNGMAGHSLIREDMHVGGGSHAGVAVIPAVLAVAQRERLGGAAVLRGIVAAYQALCTLGIAVRSQLRHRHFRPLGISGSFGAAAGVAAAMQADEATTAHALSLAANMAAGLNQWPWSGGQEIYLHAGLAARNGINAYDLARAGLRGSDAILEGNDGLLIAHGCDARSHALFREELARRWHILDVQHKPVMGCNYVQTPVACALQLRRDLPRGTGSIRAIRIDTFGAARGYPGCDSQGPFSTVEQTKMSLQYAVAAALRHAALDDGAYRQFDNQEQLRLVRATTLVVDEAFERAAPARQPARVSIELQDGRTLASQLADVPWLDAAGVHERFRRAVRGHGGIDGTTALTTLVDGFGTLQDLDPVWEALAGTWLRAAQARPLSIAGG